MRFKSLNFFVKAIGFSFIASIQAAHALTVAGASPYVISGSTMWVAGDVGASLPAGAFMDSNAGYRFFNTSMDNSNGLKNEMVVVDVKTTNSYTVTDGKLLVVSLYLKNASGSYKIAPIAAASGIAEGAPRADGLPDVCVLGTNCTGQSTAAGIPYFTGAITATGNNLRIGFYLKDVCRHGEQNTNDPTEYAQCAADVVDSPTATSAVEFAFRVGVDVIDATTENPSEVNEPAEFTLKLVNEPASFVQTGGATDCSLKDVYFPGDSEIGISMKDLRTQKSAGGATVAGILFLARKASDGLVDVNAGTYATSNNIIARLPADSSLRAVTGFENDVDYNGRFSVVDAAGIVQSFAVGTCSTEINPIRTTQIQGFLAKSDCFITSAAFGDTDGAPVQLLRQFRDEVLTRIPGGQDLIQSYYAWSPRAAQWLLEHPLFRIPILVLFAPVLALAWIAVHWVVFVSVVIAGALAAWKIRSRVWL